MQFVHSSLATRGRVDNCVVLETRKNSVDVLALSGDCVQRMTIVRNVKKDPLLYKVHQKFLIETPIRFAAMAQGRLVTVSEANVVALSECSVSLKRVAEVDLSETMASGLENFEFFAVSKSQGFLCLASRSDRVYVVAIGAGGEMEAAEVFLSGTVAHLAPGNRDTEFELIVVKDGGARMLVNLDAVKRSVTMRVDGENTKGYALCCDENSCNAVIHVCSIEISNTTNVPLPAEVTVYTDVVNQCFACQLKNQNLFLLGSDQKAGLCVTECPEFRRMWIMPNGVIAGSTEEKTMLIGFPELTAKKLAKKNLRLSDLPVVELPTTPVILGCEVVNNRLVGMSEEHLYAITNVIDIELKRSKAKVAEEDVEIFMVNPGLILASTDEKTRVLDGKAKICEDPTVGIVQFDHKTFQVHSAGFWDIETEEDVPFGSEIVSATSYGLRNQNRLLVLDRNNDITLFTKDFEDKKTAHLDAETVTTVAMGLHFIAVGCDDNLSLMDLDLLPVPRDFTLPSPCTSMCFRRRGTELFVAMANGAVARYLLATGTGFVNDFSYIFFGKPGLKIVPFEDDETLFFVDDRLHIYHSHKIYRTNLTDFESISFCLVSEERSELIFDKVMISFVKEGGLHSLTIDRSDFGVRYEPLTEITDDTTLLHAGDFLFAVSQAESEFSIYETETDSQSGPLPGVVACSHAVDRNVIIATSEKELRLYDFNSDAQSFTLATTAHLQAVPTHISHFNQHVLVCFGNTVQVAEIREGSFSFNSHCIQFPHAIRRIVHHTYLWAEFDNGTLGAMIYNQDYEELQFVGHERTGALANIYPIDDLTAAVVTQDNLVKFLRVNVSLAHGYIHDRKFPPYSKPGSFRPLSRVTAIARDGDIVIIFTADGNCCAVTGCACTASYRVLEKFQSDLRRDYAAVVGFSQPNPRCLAAQRNVVSLDTFDAYQRLPLSRSIEEAGRESYIYRLTCRERLRFLF